MQNHLHVVLRSRPGVVATWSDKEVARRWLRLFPKRKNKDGSPAEPKASEIKTITSDAKVLAERRRRQRSGWLSPVQIREASDPTGPDANSDGRRASQKGFLSCSLAEYLSLLDWTARQLDIFASYHVFIAGQLIQLHGARIP